MSDLPCKCGDWEAIEDRMPPAPKARLRVTGTLVCPTPGYVVEVKRAEPQGINATELILEISARRPTGPVIQPIGEAKFSYREEVEPGTYKTVHLRPECGTKAIRIVT